MPLLPGSLITRRTALTSAASLLAIPALGQTTCQYGMPDDHVKGPPVWLKLDQEELDAAYRQEVYQPLLDEIDSRIYSLSYDLRVRRGYPERAIYGDHPDEGMDIYRADRRQAPVFVFIHGGTWRYGNAGDSGFEAEMFMDRGAHFVALDFSDVREANNDLNVLAGQVRRGVAWVVKNADSFGGDPDRVYIGGHSSGGHLAAVALTTNWTEFGLADDALKGGLLMSGMYDMEPVRLSYRRNYIAFTDAMEEAMSPQRHIDRINAPLFVSYGTLETPEFIRQAKDFAAAVQAAGKSAQLVVGHNYFHQDMWETLGNPYGPNGRAAVEMMGL